ncbi:MAG: aminoacyl--tRNA ligase-related protein, partial [Microcoleus sp.]
MLDLKLIRENPQAVQESLNLRGGNYEIEPILQLDKQQRELEGKRSQLQARSNEIAKLIGQKRKAGLTLESPEVHQLQAEGNAVGTESNELQAQEKELKAQIEALLLPLPNLPDKSIPIGKNEDENILIRQWGDEYIPQNPDILPHWEIGEKLGILNFERAVKISKARFVTLVGAGAALERAIIQFMLDRHIKAGYVEVIPPLLVNTESLTATGQLPKFAEESFKCEHDDLWLIPTSEVPVVNLYRGEILTAEQLPIYHCSFTPCFRREAGSYGKDTRGLIR